MAKAELPSEGKAASPQGILLAYKPAARRALARVKLARTRHAVAAAR
jgi:hypothetical protein